MDRNGVIVEGLPRDWDKGLSDLRQMEVKIFGRHGAEEKSAAIFVGFPEVAAQAD